MFQHVPTTTPRTNASGAFNLLRACTSSGAGATLSTTSLNINHNNRNEGKIIIMIVIIKQHATITSSVITIEIQQILKQMQRNL